MKLLLDTHVLLWWLDDPSLLSSARDAISDPRNEALVSVAVVWEITIKAALGKLDIPDDLEQMLAAAGFTLLPIDLRHVMAVRNLPAHHRDPFDRLLAAQAVIEIATLMTRDANLLRCPMALIQA